MARELLMPKLGLTMVEGTITNWFVNEGAYVNIGDKLFEVETDKLTKEIDADTEGYLRKILVKAGKSAPVKTLIGIIAGKDEDISSLLGGAPEEVSVDEVEKPEEEVKQDSVLPGKDSDYVLATPYAKKLAADRGIDLRNVAATGYNGVVVAKDVDEFKVVSVKATPVAKKMAYNYGIDLSEIDKETRIKKDDVQALYEKKAAEAEFNVVESTETEKASSIRRITAKRMRANWTGTPMVTFNLEADMTELIQLREKLKPVYMKEGIKLTYNHLIMKILSKLLMKYRFLNASFEDDTIIYHNYVNLGIAVDTEKGLLVPNVKGTDKKTLREIAQETEQLIDDARTNKLNPDNLAGGTFTITNIGMFGMDSFTPIINKPEVAILGINRIVDKPVVVNKQIVIRPMMNLSLTTDHSLVDGVLSAKFLSEVKEIIENPYLLID